MRQIYNRAFTATLVSGGGRYVFAERIDPGYILHVHSGFAYSPLRDANDNIVIGIRNGGEDIILQAEATAAAQKGLVVGRDFFVGEGDQVFAYFPEGEDADTIGIHINGVLIPLSEWDVMAE
jgi:hypothetical protein